MAIQLAKTAAGPVPAPVNTASAPRKAEPSALARLNSIKLFESRNVSLDDLVFFTQQLGLLLETGNSLVPSIEALAAQATSAPLKRVLLAVHLRLQTGADLSECLSQHPKVFDDLFVSLIRAGEASGALQESLARITNILEVRKNLRARIREAMTYPCVLLVIMAGTMIFMMAFVIPRFAEIFEGMGDDLPASTRLILGTSDFLRSSWMFVLPTMIAVWLGIVRLLKTKPVRRARDSLLTRAPLLSVLSTRAYLFQLFSTFGLLLGSRVPLMDAIKIARKVVRNVHYEDFFDRLSRYVEEGRGISQAFQEAAFLPDTVKLMVSTGETSGALDRVMARLATYYREELESSIRRLSVVLEPVMLVVMGTMVGFIAVSFIVPIFRMSRAIH